MINVGLLQVIAQEANRPRVQVADVFKLFPYTGNATARTVNVGLDLTDGLVWASPRNGTYDQFWAIAGTDLSPNTNEADFYSGQYGPRVATTGFTLLDWAPYNENTVPYMSWSFRKHERFFTTVKYTGNGASNRGVPHDLGVTPGFIVIKRADAISNWYAQHRSATSGHCIQVNGASTSFADTTRFAAESNPASFFVGASSDTNASGGSYIAYLFAHEASLIQCGVADVDSGGAGAVTLGWEPQFLLLKGNLAGANWNVLDTARGWGTGSPKTIRLNGGGTEYSTDSGAAKTATGFTLSGLAQGKYLYMAIRKE